MTDEPQNTEETREAFEARQAESSQQEYIEFVGSEPYGTEFYGQTGTHTVSRSEMKKYFNVDLGAEEVVWKRGSNGRFLVPVSEMTVEAVEVLSTDPLFRRVTL